jgi:hypothetical protein
MGPLTPAEMSAAMASSELVRRYAQDVDRHSAREMLEQRFAAEAQAAAPSMPAPGQRMPQADPDYGYPTQRRAPAGRAPKPAPTAFEQVMKSPVTRSIATTITRGLMGALLGGLGVRRRR